MVLGANICHNLANVYLRFVYIIVYNYSKEKTVKKYWTLVSDVYAEVFRETILRSAIYFEMHKKKKTNWWMDDKTNSKILTLESMWWVDKCLL